jgi:hypothetical protein
MLLNAFACGRLAYAHDLGMTKPDGTVLLALMNGKFRNWPLNNLSTDLITKPAAQLSRLRSRPASPRIPLGQDQTAPRHLSFLLRSSSLLYPTLGLRHEYRSLDRVRDHVRVTRLELFGAMDQAHHGDRQYVASSCVDACCVHEIDTRFPRRLAEDDPSLPPLLFPIFAFSRGIGNVSSGESGWCNSIAPVLSNQDSTSCRSGLHRAAQI